MFTVLVAITITGIQDVFYRFAIEGYQPKSMSDELIRQDRSVGVYFDEVDGHSGDFREHGSTERVCKGKSDVIQNEIDMR